MKKLAVIGSGIAGMSSAYFLKDHYDVTLFEKRKYFGGHTNTIDLFDGKETVPVDTGFMVFNEETYPNLLKLFSELEVPYVNTCMSFSVRNDDIDLEYNGSDIGGIFAQKKNLFNLSFLKMIAEILKFGADAKNFLQKEDALQYTIEEYLNELGLSEYFLNNFLAPMSSAVWSTPMEDIKKFPAVSLVRFFKNHGFVGINTQLQWKTVKGGSRVYRDKILEHLGDKAVLDVAITGVERRKDEVIISWDGGSCSFDRVIIAAHADDALRMLENPSELELKALSAFKYQENIATVHHDESVMPKLRKNWSSWNFMMKGSDAYTVYYMNRLQNVSDNREVFININGEENINKDKIDRQMKYFHPIFDVEAVTAQPLLAKLQEDPQINFVGSYYRYGFHEDALLSSVNLCEKVLKASVWQK